jgi:hypothetical protein
MGVWGRRLRRRPQTPSSSPLRPRFGGEGGQGGDEGVKGKSQPSNFHSSECRAIALAWQLR